MTPEVPSVFHHLNPIYSTLDCGVKNQIMMGAVMKQSNLESKSTDELWILYEKIRAILSKKLDTEKHELERRLAQLNGRIQHNERARRPYPKVHPKYRNPERPSETWSGRGKQPRWVSAQLKRGKKINDLLISQAH
jgi:DNA-binding protein H-NS